MAEPYSAASHSFSDGPARRTSAEPILGLMYPGWLVRDGEVRFVSPLRFGLRHFLDGLMTAAAIPTASKLSKSISIFGVCSVPRFCDESDSATVFSFRSAIGVNHSIRRAVPLHP